jgi:hypothetical protein
MLWLVIFIITLMYPLMCHLVKSKLITFIKIIELSIYIYIYIYIYKIELDEITETLKT